MITTNIPDVRPGSQCPYDKCTSVDRRQRRMISVVDNYGTLVSYRDIPEPSAWRT